MPRGGRSSSSRSSSSSSSGGSRLFATKSASPAPAAKASAPAPAVAPQAAHPPSHPPQSMAPVAAPAPSGGIVSGIMGSIAQGFMFGTGSAVAHRAVDSVMGPRTIVHEHKNDEAPAATAATSAPTAAPAVASTLTDNTNERCQFEKNQFNRCMQTNDSNLEACQNYMDSLRSCQTAYKAFV